MQKARVIILGAITGIVLGAVVAIAPVVRIRLGWQPILIDPIQLIFYSMWLTVSALTGAVLFYRFTNNDPLIEKTNQIQNKFKRLGEQLMMPSAALLFFLLYFAANALCQRLNMGIFEGDPVVIEILRLAGLVLAFAGLSLQTYALLSYMTKKSGNGYESAPFLRLRHPSFFATLITLTAIPVLFGAWLPLIALPGIFVVMKWVITEQERVLVDKLGPDYELYQLSTRRLLPYIY